MRVEGYVRKDILMDLEGPHAYCMFIIILLYDECECARVPMRTDEGVHEAHDTMGLC